MIATVIDTKDVPAGTRCPVLAGFVGDDAHDRAAEFIDTLPEADTGRYGLDVSEGCRISVQTRDLHPSDVLLPTQACVLQSYAGVRTPRGKIDVYLRHPNGRQRTSPWGRYTRLTVVRHTEGS